jgi:Putative phage serine protease XkdF
MTDNEKTYYILPEEIKPLIIDHFKNVGQKKDDLIKEGYTELSETDIKNIESELKFDIESFPDEKSFLDKGNYAIRYQYSGVRDDKNRQFCADVLDLDLIFRKEDINRMSFRSENQDFGKYSIFDYKGSYNCRHKWKRLVFKKDESNTDSGVDGYKSVPNKNLPPSYSPNDYKANKKNPKIKMEINNINDKYKNMILAEIIMTKEKSISKMSLVNRPAVGIDFLKFSEEKETLKFNTNDEKQNITGVALIPLKKYYRNAEYFKSALDIDADGYIYFSQQTVKDLAMDFLKNANNSINIQHETDVNENDVELVESWFIETPNDKAYDLGFTKELCPIGTWILTEHVNNKQIWQDIKDGKINGFSIQGHPEARLITAEINMNKVTDETKLEKEFAEIILKYKEKITAIK